MGDYVPRGRTGQSRQARVHITSWTSWAVYWARWRSRIFSQRVAGLQGRAGATSSALPSTTPELVSGASLMSKAARVLAAMSGSGAFGPGYITAHEGCWRKGFYWAACSMRSRASCGKARKDGQGDGTGLGAYLTKRASSSMVQPPGDLEAFIFLPHSSSVLSTRDRSTQVRYVISRNDLGRARGRLARNVGERCLINVEECPRLRHGRGCRLRVDASPACSNTAPCSSKNLTVCCSIVHAARPACLGSDSDGRVACTALANVESELT